MNSKTQQRNRRHAKIRSRISGTMARPRLSVFKSNKYFYAQFIDDESGVTLAASSTIRLTTGTQAEKVKEVANILSKIAQEKKITKAVFDRGGFVYAGIIKNFAEAMREAGLSI